MNIPPNEISHISLEQIKEDIKNWTAQKDKETILN